MTARGQETELRTFSASASMAVQALAAGPKLERGALLNFVVGSEAFEALPSAERQRRLSGAGDALRAAGADVVIDSVADLVPALERQIGQK